MPVERVVLYIPACDNLVIDLLTIISSNQSAYRRVRKEAYARARRKSVRKNARSTAGLLGQWAFGRRER
jgi:hypothetical protein